MNWVEENDNKTIPFSKFSASAFLKERLIHKNINNIAPISNTVQEKKTKKKTTVSDYKFNVGNRKWCAYMCSNYSINQETCLEF